VGVTAGSREVPGKKRHDVTRGDDDDDDDNNNNGKKSSNDNYDDNDKDNKEISELSTH
jgi:hypothetical protein